MIKTARFYCKVHGFDPWSAKFCLPCGVAKKKKVKESKSEPCMKSRASEKRGEDGIVFMDLLHFVPAWFGANFFLLIVCNEWLFHSLLQKTGKVISISAFVTAQLHYNQTACLEFINNELLPVYCKCCFACKGLLSSLENHVSVYFLQLF